MRNVNDIISLDSDKIYTIKEIDSWFNTNWEKYNWISNRWRCKFCPTQKSIPCICIEPDEQYKFIRLYQALDEVLRFHRKEEYFRQELIEYHNAKYSDINLKIWAAKNEKIGINECTSFKIKFLDTEIDTKEDTPIRVYGSSAIELLVINKIREQIGRGGSKTKLDFEIFIQKQDFKYTIEFIKVFNDAFWVQQILPESIAKMDSEE